MSLKEKIRNMEIYGGFEAVIAEEAKKVAIDKIRLFAIKDKGVERSKEQMWEICELHFDLAEIEVKKRARVILKELIQESERESRDEEMLEHLREIRCLLEDN